MTIRNRKLLVVLVITGIALLANSPLIVRWMQASGVVDLARWVNRRFITGTAVTVIAVLLWLITERHGHCATTSKRQCRVCDRRIDLGGRYCPHCGSRA